MKMKRYAFVVCALLATICLASCTQNSGWTPEEKELINSDAYSRMRVTKTNDTADSLLLRTPSTPLTRKQIESPEFGRLVASMMETVNDPYHGGVGIAAPQVGISRQMVAVQRFDKEGEPFEFFLNPEIVERIGEKEAGGEGCLSVPEIRGDVERWQTIRLRYRDEQFVEREELIEGFTAVIFQHELDHLDGKLFIDYLE